MREIKFRVWSPLNKKMYKLGKIEFEYGLTTLFPECWQAYTNSALEPEAILLQYTGLTDKNGKEIYEGDLLRCFGQIPCKKERNDHIGKISYFIHGFQIFLWDGKDWCAPKRISYCADQLEVIGNIYENPELL